MSRLWAPPVKSSAAAAGSPTTFCLSPIPCTILTPIVPVDYQEGNNR